MKSKRHLKCEFFYFKNSVLLNFQNHETIYILTLFFKKLFFSITVFSIDNENKYFLSIRSAYYNDF